MQRPEGMESRQLSLGVQLRDDATFDNFYRVPDASPALAALEQQMASADREMIFLCGGAGVGKSHLLQASCHLEGMSALYLPLAELAGYSPDEVLQGLTGVDRLCLDDIDAVLGNALWERALFNLYNETRQQQCALVIAASAAPRALAVDLEDLRSRLSAGVVFQMPVASDDEKAQILQYRAARRGMTLTPEIAQYIVHRSPRSMQALLQVLDELDQVTLERKRALSIPLVRQVFGW